MRRRWEKVHRGGWGVGWGRFEVAGRTYSRQLKRRCRKIRSATIRSATNSPWSSYFSTPVDLPQFRAARCARTVHFCVTLLPNSTACMPMMGSRASNQRSTVKFRSFGLRRSQMSMIRSRSTGHEVRAAGRCENGLGRGSTCHDTAPPPPPTAPPPTGRAFSPSEALPAALKDQTS